jgi:hypothetical protein
MLTVLCQLNSGILWTITVVWYLILTFYGVRSMNCQ